MMVGDEIGGSQSDVTIGNLSMAFLSLKEEMGPSPFNTSVAIWLAAMLLEAELLI